MGPRRDLGWGSRTGLGEWGAPGPPEASTQPSSGGFAPTPTMVGVHPRDWWGPGRGACAHISWERWGILGASLGGGSKMGGALRPEVAEETHLSQAQALPRSPVPGRIPQDGLGSWRAQETQEEGRRSSSPSTRFSDPEGIAGPPFQAWGMCHRAARRAQGPRIPQGFQAPCGPSGLVDLAPLALCREVLSSGGCVPVTPTHLCLPSPATPIVLYPARTPLHAAHGNPSVSHTCPAMVKGLCGISSSLPEVPATGTCHRHSGHSWLTLFSDSTWDIHAPVHCQPC